MVIGRRFEVHEGCGLYQAGGNRDRRPLLSRNVPSYIVTAHVDAKPTPQQTGFRSRQWIPGALLTLFALQSLWFIKTQSLTYDEPAHIIAGAEAWQHKRFERWNDHPPLGRLWLTLPIAASDAHFDWQQLPLGFRVTAIQPGPEWIAWHTRPMNILLGVALGMTLWFATCRLFSEGAANVALGLFIFTPSIIANFSLATTDGIGALFIFLVAFQIIRWRRNPTPWRTVVMGLLLGGLLLSKFYAPPLVVLALVLMLVLGRNQLLTPQRWNWKPMLGAAAIALTTLWAGYFFHVSHLKIGDGQVVATYPNRAMKTWVTKSQAQMSIFVPAGEFFEGLRDVALSNRRGRAAWFLGQIYPRGGIRMYYPVAIALKWPTILLLLFLASLLLGVRTRFRAPGDLLVMCLFGFVYFVFALQSKYDIGERHILPLYPFVLLVAGGIWEHARKHGVAKGVIILALCLNAADALRYAPDYLAYFNIFVRPQNSWRLLTDSNLDWGQGLIAVRNYEREHPGEQLHLAYFGSVDPALYGVHAASLAPDEHEDGTIVVGASCLSGQILENSQGYHWLWNYQPRQMIDHSMFVFDTPGKKSPG